VSLTFPLLGPAPTDQDTLAQTAAWYLERRQSLDLTDLTLSDGELAGLFRHRRCPPPSFPTIFPTDGLQKSASFSPPYTRACATATNASPSTASSKETSP